MPSIPSALAARFSIGSELWSGSSGVVYDATEVSTNRVGVLKIVTQATAWTPAERGRLARELEKQATLSHPYLATPLAAGIAEDVPWIFRNKLEGEALSARIARGPLPVTEAVTIAAQLASGLDELHRAGLLQRDLSPGHVILGANGSSPFVRVIDSGVATRIPGSAIFEISGKPPYVSPEHAAGKLVSFRSDLYALGSILFEMLTGQPIFSGTIEQVLDAQRSTPPPTLANAAPGLNVPGAISTLLGQLLAKDPRERPFSAQQVRRTLEPLVPEGGLAHAHAPAPGAGSGSMMKRTLLGVPSPTSPKRADATEELSSLDLQQAAAALRPPPPRRDETMPLQAMDLLPAIAPPLTRSVPPPVPGSQSGSTIVSPAPRASTPPPAPEKRASLPPPVPPGARASSSGGLAVPPAPSSSPGIAMAPQPHPSSSGGLAVPPAPAPPAPPQASVIVAPAGDLDYDDLAETNAVSREDFEERQVTHRAQAINDLALAPPPGALPPLMAVAPMAQASFPPTQMQPQQGYGMQPQQGFGAQPAYGTPSPFGPTQMMPQTGTPGQMPQQMQMGQPAMGMPGTQMMPQASMMGGMQPQSMPAMYQPSVSPDEVAGLGRARSPFLILGGLVVGCFVFSLAGFGGYALVFGHQPGAEAVAATPTVTPTVAPVAMQPMMPTVTSAPATAVGTITPIAPAPQPTIAPLPPPVIAPLPPASIAPLPTPLVPVVAAPEPEPTRPPPSTRTSSHTSSRPAPPPAAPPPTSTASTPPRSGGLLASRIGPHAAPPPTTTAAPPPSGAGRLASRLGSHAAPPTTTSAAPSSGGSFDDLRARARTAFSAHHYDEAASAYEQASRLQPSNAGIFAGLGAARLAGGNASAAVTAYQRAVQLQPSSAGYHAALGRAYATAGDSAHARTQYEEALRLDPDNRDARTGLSRL